MLQLKNLKLSYGSNILFTKANLQVYKGQKVGLVGQNGAGKTSLFKLILAKIYPESGELTLTKNVLISYVEQEIEKVNELLVNYILSAHPIYITEQTDLPEYYQLKPNAEKLLISLGFRLDELYLPLSKFSGGWAMRANLAKALFQPSDVLLLDEPTNHLDVETVIWLEDWLKKYNGLALIISHDREFLDQVTSHTLAINNKSLTLYTGNYSTFENTRYMQLEQQAQQTEKTQAKINHLQSFVNRFKAKATKAKQAQSRVKMIEKLQISQVLPKDIQYNIEFLMPEYQTDKILTIAYAQFGYTNKILIKNVTLDIFQDSRIGLLGRNGIGKSTLIKGLIDKSTLLNGVIEINSKVKIGYFAQNTVDQLDLNDTPLSFFTREYKHKRENELRSYLGSYGLSGNKVVEQIKNFSGGEKARLTIANIIYQRPNILFLDEPTNHLDMQMREELADALQSFNGAVVIVSHDKFLLQSVVDDYYLINNYSLTKFNGNLDEYHQQLILEDNTKNKIKKPVNKIKLASEIKSLEKKINIFEQKLIHLTYDSIEYDTIKKKLAIFEDKWLELQDE